MKNVNGIIYDNRSLQMDFAAVRMASDSDFQALGIRRRGDILALKSFVLSAEENQREKEGKKRKLLELTKQLASKSLKRKIIRRRW